MKIDQRTKEVTLTEAEYYKLVNSPVSEELEEAAEDYGIRQGAELKPFAIKFFKTGANWQKQQDQSTIELAEDHAMLAGMEKMKEQMIDKACVWLEKNTGFFNEKDFRKAMED